MKTNTNHRSSSSWCSHEKWNKKKMECSVLYAISKNKQISILFGFYAKIGKRLAANELLLFPNIYFHRRFKILKNSSLQFCILKIENHWGPLSFACSVCHAHITSEDEHNSSGYKSRFFFFHLFNAFSPTLSYVCMLEQLWPELDGWELSDLSCYVATKCLASFLYISVFYFNFVSEWIVWHTKYTCIDKH